MRLVIAPGAGRTQWRWTLIAPDGATLRDAVVGLDSESPEYRAFTNLSGFLAHHEIPYKYSFPNTTAFNALGDWIGRHVLGAMGDAILAAPSPRIVHVSLTETTRWLAECPLEFGFVDGRPLLLQNTTFVYGSFGASHRPTLPSPKDATRILVVLSSPVGPQELGLRKEGHLFTRWARQAADAGLALRVTVLQYGVTRSRLTAALLHDPAWDIVHVSTHASPGAIYLEADDGRPEPLTGEEFVRLLRSTGARPRLVGLFACETAAPTAKESESASEPSASIPFAAMLSSECGCLCLAMRHRIDDSYATRLASHFYPRLLLEGLTVAEALQLAISSLHEEAPSEILRLRYATAPCLIGAQAAELTFRIAGPVNDRNDAAARDALPARPETFAGRAGALGDIARSLGAQSPRRGVFLLGAPGIGKTSCAIEAVHAIGTHQFDRIVWYSLANSDETNGPQHFLALCLPPDTPSEIPAADALRRLLSDHRLLVCLDGLDALFDPRGLLRDRRWSEILTALREHGGRSRLLVTSRLDTPVMGDALLIPRIHLGPLSPEATALACRMSSHLARLADRDSDAVPLLPRLVRILQGDPTLVALADSLAADGHDLAAHLAYVDARWREAGTPVLAFLEHIGIRVRGALHVRHMRQWLRAAHERLDKMGTMFWHFLCALEPADRNPEMLDVVWGEISARVPVPYEQSSYQLASQLMSIGLATPPDTGARLTLHPLASEVVRVDLPRSFLSGVDALMSDAWVRGYRSQFISAMDGNGGANLNQEFAGQHAAPYLLRQKRWEDLLLLLEGVFRRDCSEDILSRLLPLVDHVIAHAQSRHYRYLAQGVKAFALRQSGAYEESRALETARYTYAVERGDHRMAWTATGGLIHIGLSVGNLEGVEELLARHRKLGELAGLGPISRLVTEGQELQVLMRKGEWSSLLARGASLLATLDLAQWGGIEVAEKWLVTEIALEAMFTAHHARREWQQAVEIGEDLYRKSASRQAPWAVIARRGVKLILPLRMLGRHSDAVGYYDLYRDWIAEHGSADLRADLYVALSFIERDFGHWGLAVTFQRAALAATYEGNASGRAIGLEHCNLAARLVRGGDNVQERIAHRLAGLILLQEQKQYRMALKGLVEDLVESRTSFATVQLVASRLPELLGEFGESFVAAAKLTFNSESHDLASRLVSVVSEANRCREEVEAGHTPFPDVTDDEYFH